MHACMHMCVCVCVYVCMCTYIYMICKYVCWAPHIWLVPYNAGATCWDPSWVMARPSTSWWARSRWLSPATSMLRWTREVPNISCRAALSWQWMSGSTAPWIPERRCRGVLDRGILGPGVDARGCKRFDDRFHGMKKNTIRFGQLVLVSKLRLTN